MRDALAMSLKRVGLSMARYAHSFCSATFLVQSYSALLILVIYVHDMAQRTHHTHQKSSRSQSRRTYCPVTSTALKDPMLEPT